MGKNLLEQLREVTVVVADTGDIQAIETFKPRDATTNPSLITAAAQMPQYQGIVDDTLKAARTSLGQAASAAQVVSLAFDRLAVSFGLKILEIIPGRVGGVGYRISNVGVCRQQAVVLGKGDKKNTVQQGLRRAYDSSALRCG